MTAWLVTFDDDGDVDGLTRFDGPDGRERAETAQASQLRLWQRRAEVLDADDARSALDRALVG